MPDCRRYRMSPPTLNTITTPAKAAHWIHQHMFYVCADLQSRLLRDNTQAMEDHIAPHATGQ
jgi:hypothetical protein